MPVSLLRPDALADSLAGSVPYAYASVLDSGLVFTAGASPLDASGAVVAVGDVAGQTRQVMENLTAALAAAGCGLTDVAKTVVYVASSDRDDLVTAWQVYCEAMAGHDAPSTLLGVTVLGYPGQQVEVEAIAVRPQQNGIVQPGR